MSFMSGMHCKLQLKVCANKLTFAELSEILIHMLQ